MTAKAKMRDGIVQRGATWSYKIQTTDPATGRRKPKWVGGFPTRAAAKAARDKARVNVNEGTYIAPAKQTVAEYLTAWLDGQRTQLKRSTLESYRQQVDRYLIPGLGGDRLQQLNAARLNAWYGQMLQSGGADGGTLSLRTVRYCHAVLHKALADAVKQQLVTVNAAAMADTPKQSAAAGPAAVAPEDKIQAWTAEQVRAFASAGDGSALHDSFLLAINTGLRRGEVYGLTWGDVDLKAGRLRVRQALATIGHTLEIQTPKSGKSRSFRLDPTTVALLSRRRKAQAADKLAWPGEWGNDADLVFTHEDGRPIHPTSATKAFGRAAKAVGLPAIRFHDMRHTYATLALRAGVNIRVVSKRLGHSTPQITWTVYAHVLPDEDDHAADLFHTHVYGGTANG